MRKYKEKKFYDINKQREVFVLLFIGILTGVSTGLVAYFFETLINNITYFKNYLFNITNNKMSINIYLNEYCKDAMNLTDFLNTINISLDDLLYTKNHGYVKGIGKIFEKQLLDLKPTQRPIHCSDKKRMHFYVKDENTWEKDNDHNKIDKSIQCITMKQIKKIKEWEFKNPHYLTNEKLLMEWHIMVRAIMGGSQDGELYKNKLKIKKNLSKVIKEI